MKTPPVPTLDRNRAQPKALFFASALALAVLSGCLLSQTPQTSDTATNWLVVCVDDAECGGVSSCLGFACSLPCSGKADDACEAVSSSATCQLDTGSEEGACDVECEAAADCGAVSPMHTCVAGRCRAPRTSAGIDGGFANDIAATEPWTPLPSSSSSAGSITSAGLKAASGDYVFRTVTETQFERQLLGVVSQVTTNFGMMRVSALESGPLVAQERLCEAQVTTATSESGSSLAVTTSPEVVAALSPIERALSISSASWALGPATRRTGFVSTLDALPTDLSRPEDFLDPDRDGFPGARTTFFAVAPGLSLECAYDMVTSWRTRYTDGLLDTDGALATAAVVLDASEAHALRATRTDGVGRCSPEDINGSDIGQILRDEITLVKVPSSWGDFDLETCFGSSRFQQVFP